MIQRLFPTLRKGEPCEVGICPVRLRRLATCAAEWVDEGLSQAIAYVVARNGVLVAEQAFGVASYLTPKRALAESAVFALASATKPITATAIMLLVEDGRLSLNRPLVEYLPEVRGRNADRILVHQLLTHTSGYTARSAYPRFRDAFRSTAPIDVDANQDELIQRYLDDAFALDPELTPGSENSYCGIVNYLFLGEIVRRVSGTGLAEFARQRIFSPLEMNSTSYGITDELGARRVVPNPAIYAGIDDYDPNDPVRLRLPHGGGGAFSSAADMAVFTQLFLNGGGYGAIDLLSPASVRAMTQNQIPGIGTRDGCGRWIAEASWGLGWMVQGAERWRRAHGALQPVGTFYHQGASGAGIWADPASGVLGVFLSVIGRMDPRTEEFFWEFDRFQNLVMAAVSDPR